MGKTEPSKPPTQPQSTPPGVPPVPQPETTSSSAVTPAMGLPAVRVQEGECSPEVKAAARTLYESYILNSGGLNYEGKQCPPWDQLTVAVRSHWCAAAIEASHHFQGPLLEHAEKLKAMHEEALGLHRTATHQLAGLQREHEAIKRSASMSRAGQEHEVMRAAASRTSMLDQEVDKLREQLAKVEADLRAANAKLKDAGLSA